MGHRCNKELEDDIQELTDWLSQQPHLPQGVNVELIKCFVHGTKSLEEAKKRMDSYFTIRNKWPELFCFTARDPSAPAFKEASKAGKVFYLPKPTPEGYRVIFNIVTDDYHLFDHRQEIIRNMMLMELGMLLWPDMKGVAFVYDLKRSFQIMPKISLTYTISMIQWFQGTFPLKMKKAVLFNAPTIFSVFLNSIVKRWMKKKIFERIVMVPEERCIKEYIPQDMLPLDYGGKEPSSELLNKQWLEMLENQKHWFQETSQQFSDETKRPNKPKTSGMFQRFRNYLNI